MFWLDRLRLSGIYQEWGLPQAKRSVEGNPIKLKGRTFERGIGTHANSEIIIDLRRSALAFESVVGLDDEKTGEGSIVFQVWVDGRKIYDSGIMRGGDEPKEVKVDLRGAGQLMLRVTDAGDDINCDHADWADARLELDPASQENPRIFKFVDKEEPQIAESRPEEPGIHGPGIAGTTPGRPFIFLVPATGKKPLSFSAKNLPRNLVLDPVTGIITGSVEKPGTYEVEIFAQDSAKNKASRTLVIVAGQGSLCLTPPMGWNSWNIWAGDINEERVREAAESMVSTGLASHGYQYINIDDCWQGSRDEKGKIRPNAKFKDMKALADYVHGMGLRIGTYSSPGPKTCGGFEGSEGFEEKDAQTYAEWGMDCLKYDWCS
ncbi:alpha-galactosidase, partial [Candidatus Desantisbacteria bacterium CG02_land_8_20_14_3_00_49_13]